MVEIDFVEDKENFQWKGHGPLLPKEGSISIPRGFKPQLGVQLTPAAPITALSVQSEWRMIAVGTVHGFVLFDYLNKKIVATKWTVIEGMFVYEPVPHVQWIKVNNSGRPLDNRT